MEDIQMNNEYTNPEVIEIGKAQEVILGEKEGAPVDNLQPQFIADSDFDE
jgi:hypothetical protein